MVVEERTQCRHRLPGNQVGVPPNLPTSRSDPGSHCQPCNAHAGPNRPVSGCRRLKGTLNRGPSTPHHTTCAHHVTPGPTESPARPEIKEGQ